VERAYTLPHVCGNVPWLMKAVPEADTLDELTLKWSGE
jgi:hygromycin-B 7''-O-kinase